ncbi:MAG: hypothetical protein ACRD15_05440 [Vicinamibacterales bacterium]
MASIELAGLIAGASRTVRTLALESGPQGAAERGRPRLCREGDWPVDPRA